MTPDDLDLPARILDRIVPEPMSGCWLWIGPPNKHGYGRTRWGKGAALVHRVILEAATGRLEPAAMHTCDTPACCHPGHLKWGTQADNNKDMTRKGRHGQSRKTRCPEGHSYGEENTYRTPSGGRRECRVCRRARSLRYWRGVQKAASLAKELDAWTAS